MKNLEISRIFYQIAEYLEMDEVSFRSRAYTKAARFLETLEMDIEEVYKEGGVKRLKDLPGIGQAIAEKIEEYLKTGQIKFFNKLKKECPVDLEKLTSVEGLGARKIKVLYKELNVMSLEDLERAAKNGKIRELDGFGEKSEQNILQSIEFVRAGQNRFYLGVALPLAKNIVKKLEKLPEVKKVSLAGSVRRMKETIGDLDILVVSKTPERVMDFFTQMPGVVKIWAKGETKSSVRLEDNLDCDLRVVKASSFGAALQYFTGSQDHNILTRRIAKKKGLKLNEYGVFKGKKQIAGKNEKEVYNSIGLPYIEPELRTNSGEIKAALKNELPDLIGYSDIKGETQCHTNWSDGKNTISQMAKAAKKLGYEYIIITDHAGELRVANALNEKSILRQMKEIDKVNREISGIKVLKGAEVDIKMDGSLSIKNEILEKLDFVLGAVHSGFKMSSIDMTQRLLRAIENKHLNVIAHPTGRVLLKRKSYTFDFDKIFETAKKHKTALEINANYWRLDLNDANITKGIKRGIKFTLGTDAHDAQGLEMMEYGIAQARRGWASKSDILNTKSFTNFLKYFNN